MIVRKSPVVALALVLVLALAGCGSCKGSDEPAREASPLAFLPQQPRGVVHVPDLVEVGQTVAVLEKTRIAELAAAALGATGTEQIVRPLVRQLGFDPRQADGFAEAGIDGKRGLAIGADDEGRQLLVIGVADEGRFGSYVAGLAKKLGGTVRGKAAWTAPATDAEGKGAPVQLTTFATPEGSVQVAYGLRDGFAVLGSDADAVEAAGSALARPWERSLANSPTHRRMMGKLGERDLTIWAPKGAALPGRRGASFEEGLALGVDASASGVNLRALIPRGALELAVLQPAGKKAGGELARLLPPDNFFALRLGGEPQALQPVIQEILPRGLFVRLRRAGIDPATEILRQLQPGIVVGLGLNPEIDLSGGLPVEAAVSRTNPFDFVTATLYARVKDPARAAEVLEKLAAGAGHFRMEVASEEVEGQKIYRATYAAGEGMSWTLRGDTLVATGGEGMLAAALERLAAEEPKPFEVSQPSAKRVFESSASAAHLDMPRLTAALRGIPESAYGIGGFRIKAVVETWVDLLGEIEGVTASVSVDNQGLVVDADLGLK